MIIMIAIKLRTNVKLCSHYIGYIALALTRKPDRIRLLFTRKLTVILTQFL